MATKLVKDMTCSELCAWLKDQKIDEGCCKVLTETNKIDGTAFLCLTMEYLMTDLGIEALGDRLKIDRLVKMAQQQQEEEHEAEPFPLCYSYKLLDTEASSTSQPSDASGAFIISRDKLWPKEKKYLKVCFMDDVPDTWRYGSFNSPIGKDKILDWAMVWHDNLPAIDGQEYIPKFVASPSKQEADIRVRFGSGANWSKIGTDATLVNSDEPTMTLNLGSPREDYKLHLVRHEFGHALGLGHEHQSPNAPALLEKDALISKLAPLMPGDSEAAKREAAAAKYKQDYVKHSVHMVEDDAVITKYDPDSIMQYWIAPEYLKDPTKYPKGIGLDPLTTMPSNTDLRTLAKHYKEKHLCPKKVSAGGRRTGTDYSEPQHGPDPVSVSTIPPPTTSGNEQVPPPPVVSTTPAVTELPSLAIPIFDQRPEMRELQLIKWYKGGQEKHLRIIASTAPQWENLGTTFGISPAELKGFKLVNMLNQEGCYRDVLQRWLQNGSQPRDAYAVTWRGLIQALRDTSLRKIADELQTALCKSSSSSDVTQQCGAPPATHGQASGGRIVPDNPLVKTDPDGHSKLLHKRATIIRKLAELGFTRELGEKLLGAEVITLEIYNKSKNFAPGVVEEDRATTLFNAVLAGVELNAAKYDKFILILKQIRGSDDLVAFIDR